MTARVCLVFLLYILSAEGFKRLPDILEVKSYNLEFKTYWTSDLVPLRYDGDVEINVKMKKSTDQIIINSRELNWLDTSVHCGRHDLFESKEPARSDYDGFVIKLNESVHHDDECSIKISYKGRFSHGETGLYASKYIENGRYKIAVISHFKPIYARTVFPCFDEPHFKATFNLSVIRPPQLEPTLSNSLKLFNSFKMNKQQTRDLFYPTPNISTYNFGFILSQFKPSDDCPSSSCPVNVWTRKRLLNNTEYAKALAEKSLAFMEGYTNTTFLGQPNRKIDNVGVPNHMTDGIGLWGINIFRENLLVPDLSEISTRNKVHIAFLVAQKIAQQWFGSMVTCSFWTYVWLNDGLSNLFAYIILEKIAPELEISDVRIFNQLYSSLEKDTIRPNSMTIDHEHLNLNKSFTYATNKKAGAVLHMIKSLIGEKAFKAAIQNYLHKFMWDVTSPHDLFEALQDAVSKTKTLRDYSHGTAFRFIEMMKIWTENAGYPTIQVDIDYSSKSVFIIQHNHVKKSVIFYIPISFTTSVRPNFTNSKPAIILAEKSHRFKMDLKKDDWVIFNIKHEGYYRVNYSENNWLALEFALLRTPDIIHPINRAQIISDVFYLTNKDVAFSTTQFLQYDTHVIPWISAVRVFKGLLLNCYTVQTFTGIVRQHIRQLMEVFLNEIGFEERAYDTTILKIFRNDLLHFAYKVGMRQFQEQVFQLFNNVIDSDTYKENPDIWDHVFCVGFYKNENVTLAKVKLIIMSEETSTIKRSATIYALGCYSHNRNSLEMLHEELMESLLTPSECLLVLNSMVENDNAYNVLKLLTAHYDRYKKIIGINKLNILLSMIPFQLNDEQLYEYKNFLKSKKIVNDNVAKVEIARKGCVFSDTSYLKEKYQDPTYLDAEDNTAPRIQFKVVLFIITLFQILMLLI